MSGIRRLNGSREPCYEAFMLKAYVGVASKHGLAVLQPEGDDTRSLIRPYVQSGHQELCFWVVLNDTEARSVRALFLEGHRQEALWLLDRSAKDMGSILPSDAEQPLAH